MSKKLFVLFALLVAVSVLLAACGGEAATPEVVEVEVVKTVIVEKEGQSVVETQVVVVTATPDPNAVAPAEEESAETPTLRINLGTWPDTIDPQKSSYVNEIAHLKLMYEGLTKYNEKLETVPGAAESWEYNDDATELTFKLREGLTYSDGSPLNAKRFEYSIKRNINPETGGEYASITDEILGASEWRTGVSLAGESACASPDGCTDEEKAALEAALGVVALDSAGAPCADYEQADCLTLKISLARPAPYFHTVMGLWVTFPAKEENIDEGGSDWWTSSLYHTGNGPFVLESMEPAVRSFFAPNPAYWQGQPQVNLEYSYIVDSAVAFAAYQANEFDIVPSAAEDLAVIDADPALKAEHLVYPGSCTTVIKFGLGTTSPFSDEQGGQKLREAFAYAFDAQGWATDVDSGLSTPTWTWIPPGYPGYKEVASQFDPEKAKAALDEWGGADKFNALGLKLTYGASPRNEQRSVWLADNYKKHLGVDIGLDPVEATTFTAITKDPETFPILARQGWCADYPDPQNWLSVYWKSTTTFAQRQGYANPEFDALVDQADVTLDPVERMSLYEQAQDLMLSTFPGAFGYNNANHFLVKPWVKGLLLTPQDSGWPGEQSPLTITIDESMKP